MAILVDYRCPACHARTEHWAPTPPPASVPCGACGAESRRLFAAIGLSGTRPPSETAPTSSGSTVRGPRMCQRYPQIPGLCHMSESAQRMWVAKATGNYRAVDREQERQERAAAVQAPTVADVITHEHHDPRVATPTQTSVRGT